MWCHGGEYAARGNSKSSGWLLWMAVTVFAFVLEFSKHAEAVGGVTEINQARVMIEGITAIFLI